MPCSLVTSCIEVPAQFRCLVNEIERRWTQMKTMGPGEIHRQVHLT